MEEFPLYPQQYFNQVDGDYLIDAERIISRRCCYDKQVRLR